MPFGFVFDLSIVASRAHQLTVEYVADSRALRLLRRANCVHAHCSGGGGTDVPPLPRLIVAGGWPRPGLTALWRAASRAGWHPVAIASAVLPRAAGRHAW